MSAPRDELAVSADADGVRAAVAFADRFAAANRMAAEEQAHLRLIIEELLTNLVKYGYPHPTSRGGASIALAVERDRLRLDMVDDGVAFDPLAVATPDLDLPVEQRAVGGLGLHLVRSLAAEARYERADGRNRLTLVRQLGRRDPVG
jgi:anti-sigma regulatory factor (Ser/Thr protein kinase)